MPSLSRFSAQQDWHGYRDTLQLGLRMVLLLIVPATVATVPLGAKLAHSLSQTGLRRAFALFLGITSLRMFTDVFG